MQTLVDQALNTVTYWISMIFGVFAGVLEVIDNALRRLLGQIGVTGELQTAIIVIVAVLIIIWILQAFGGLIRILLSLFLILLVLHLLLPYIH